MKKELFKIGPKAIGVDTLFFTIEEGMANLGDYNKALEMVDAAANIGADAIEFQLVIANDLYLKSHTNFDFCTRCEFSNSQISELVAYTKSKGLEFIAVPLSKRLINPIAKAGCSGFNINASDINNPHIIDAVIESGIPFFLSSLMATEKEIDWAVNRIQKKGSSHFSILHGQHTMMSGGSGVIAAQTSLGYIRTLKKKYNVPVGFVDHTPYIWMPAAAVSAGADSVSKHLALSRNSKGPDWQVCLEPDEMKESVNWARELKESINTKQKIIAFGEELDRNKMRKSIVASKNLYTGDILTYMDIEFKRPGLGIMPSNYEVVVGRRITRNIEENEFIRMEDLEMIKE